MRLVLFLIVWWLGSGATFGQVATYGGRTYTPQSFPRALSCSCGMCQNLRAQWAASNLRSAAPQANQAVLVAYPQKTAGDAKIEPLAGTPAYRTETRYRAEAYQVRVCRGRYCTIETRYRQVPYTVQVPVTGSASVPAAPPAPSPSLKAGAVTKESIKQKAATRQVSDATPQIVVDAMLAVMGLDDGDTLWDLGCGDARFLITAAQRYGCRGVGIEIDSAVAESARQTIRDKGLAERITIIVGDAAQQEYGAARKVVIYQHDDLMQTLVNKLVQGTLVATYAHQPPIECKAYEVDGMAFFIGRK